MNRPEYYKIVEHYERCLLKYGPNYKGMDWPNERDLYIRFQVMLEVVKEIEKRKISLLDLGCGVGLLVDFLKQKNILKKYKYMGIDISYNMIEIAKKDILKFFFNIGSVWNMCNQWFF